MAYYELRKEIAKTEREIFNNKYYEGNGFVWFEEIREKFWELYKIDDDSEYSIMEWFEMIIDDGMEHFNFDLLTEEEKIKQTSQEGDLFIMKSDTKNYPHAIVKFVTIEEVADYVLSNQ